MNTTEKMESILRKLGVAPVSVWCGSLTGNALLDTHDSAARVVSALQGAGYANVRCVPTVRTLKTNPQGRMFGTNRECWRVGWHFPR